MRPGVVWFGEMLPPGAMEAAERAARASEVMLVVGTSGAVWPAAGLAAKARRSGAFVAIVNPHASEMGRHLLLFPVPSFAAFIVIKGLIALLLMVEAAAILLPLVTTWLSKWLTEHVHSNPNPSRFLRFLDSLNITPTRPASFLWLSIKYHYQFSVPSGGFIPWSRPWCFTSLSQPSSSWQGAIF